MFATQSPHAVESLRVATRLTLIFKTAHGMAQTHLMRPLPCMHRPEQQACTQQQQGGATCRLAHVGANGFSAPLLSFLSPGMR